MADVNRGNRPLSPHLMIYRPQITSISSIFIRITGNALLISALLAVWWLLALASGPEAFAMADGILTSWFGDLVLLFSAWGLWYHLLGGLRHLYWDITGTGYDIPTAEAMGWAMFAISFGLTLGTLILV